MADLVIQGLHAKIDGTGDPQGHRPRESRRARSTRSWARTARASRRSSNVLMGHPAYEVTAGSVLFKGEDLLELEPDERSRLGLFLAFQYPHADPRRHGGELPAPGRQRAPQGRARGRRQPDPRARVPRQLREAMELLQIDQVDAEPLPQRRVLRRREEARRDPADGDAEARDRDPRRDRLGPRHRRAADRRRRRQRACRARRWACS